MGVYLPNMEMPKNCFECPMVSGYEIADEVRTICSTVRCRLTNTKRPAGEAIASDCPLTPVPPHGRLIDADALSQMFDPDESFGAAVLEIIVDTPTIIPAEEDET